MHPEPVNMGLGGLWRGQNAPDSGEKATIYYNAAAEARVHYAVVNLKK